MTNKDKFLKDGVSASEFKTDFCRYLSINGYDTSTVGNICFALEHFLEQPIKPTLTEDERVILRNIKNEEYNGIIGREDDTTYQVGKLYLKSKYSGVKAFAFSTLYNHLFQFIKERRGIFY